MTGGIFSAAPAFAMSRTDPMEALGGVGRGGQSRSFVPRRSLVVIQAALSFVLLAGAALLASSLGQLQQQPLGFEPEGRAMVRLDLDTYRTVPWDGGVPFFLGHFVKPDGSPLAICPRRTLPSPP